MTERADRYAGKPRYACKLFYCDHRRGSFCCRECPQKDHCPNPCRNDPERCKAYRGKKETTQ